MSPHGELAERLVNHPGAQPLKNSLYPLNCALDAAAFIAPTSPLLRAVEKSVENSSAIYVDGLMIMLRHLTYLGADFRWAAKFVPVMMPDADASRCAPYRYAHVKLGLRQQLRNGYASVLKERLARNAPPVKSRRPA